jgi:hypothetical protein
MQALSRGKSKTHANMYCLDTARNFSCTPQECQRRRQLQITAITYLFRMRLGKNKNAADITSIPDCRAGVRLAVSAVPT